MFQSLLYIGYIEHMCISWLELTPRSFVPLATLKSKVLPIQLAQDTAVSQKCCLYKLVAYILNSFQLLRSVGQVSRMKSKKDELIQDKLEAVMSKYHKMDTKKYPNIFGCHIVYQMNIRIYLDAKYLPNKYPNIFVFRK